MPSPSPLLLLLALAASAAPGQQSYGWFSEPKSVAVNTAFTLRILNEDYGSCQTEFANAYATVTDGNIDAAFRIVSHSDRVCIIDERPWGPSFPMPGMAEGIYPVRIQIIPECSYAKPPCDIAWIPQEVGTLTVRGPAAAARREGAAPFSALPRPGGVEIRLPEGPAGTWTIEAASLAGGRLAAARGKSGETRLLELAEPLHGVLLLRLTGPGGETRTKALASPRR